MFTYVDIVIVDLFNRNKNISLQMEILVSVKFRVAYKFVSKGL